MNLFGIVTVGDAVGIAVFISGINRFAIQDRPTLCADCLSPYTITLSAIEQISDLPGGKLLGCLSSGLIFLRNKIIAILRSGKVICLIMMVVYVCICNAVNCLLISAADNADFPRVIAIGDTNRSIIEISANSADSPATGN